MFREAVALIPEEGFQILLVLFLSFLIGLSREEKKSDRRDYYVFGGVRTFPLIGLLGYGCALLSGDQLLPLAFAFAVVGSFLLVSFLHKLQFAESAGITTEMSGLITFVLGVLVQRELYWIASTIVVISLLLLELKQFLEGLSDRIRPQEIITFTKFLLLTVVILPVVPNQDFTAFKINPFKTWVVVVAVSTVSYGSYVVQKLTKGKGGVLLSAILGGAYSSTVTTVVLAKKAAKQGRPNLYAGAILLASGLMYLRLVILVGLFNRALMGLIIVPFLVLSASAVFGGWLVSRIGEAADSAESDDHEHRNPLEFRAAFLFAAIFLIVLVVTEWVFETLGTSGVSLLAFVMGIADVDPFILGLTNAAGVTAPLQAAAAGIIIAAASNNAAKGAYAFIFADRPTGIRCLALLGGLAGAGFLPLLLVL